MPRNFVIACAVMLTIPSQTFAQTATNNDPINVDRGTHSVGLIAKTSRMLNFSYDIPELVVDNQYVIRATPISANQILLTALKPGVATITVSDAQGSKQLIDVLVSADVRPLELRLQQIFPSSNLKAVALETGVVLSGTIVRADQVDTAMKVAGEYFPTVHNNMHLPDSQMIAIEVQVYEIARTKVRELGIDWKLTTADIALNVLGSTNIQNTLAFSVVNGGDQLDVFLQALERKNLARLLDRPTLVTSNGRPAEFLEGGEIPFEVNQGLGNTTIQFRPFGTKLDVVPIVQGEGTIRLEVRAEVSEPSSDLSSANGTNGFRVRRVNTGVDMKIGHTLVLAGDIREETETTVHGIPVLMNMPYVGALFRRTSEKKSEIELIFLLTPRFIGEVDPGLMPSAAPGTSSTSPSDSELYLNGYTEVPRCGPECGGITNTPLSSPYPGNYSTPNTQPLGYPAPATNGTPIPRPPATAPTYSIGSEGTSAGFGFPNRQQQRQAVPKTSKFSLKNIFK